MRRLPGQVLCLGIAHDGLALVRTGGVFGARTAVLAEARVEEGGDAGDPHALARALRALQAEAGIALAGWPLRVVLADELARLWPVTPPPGAATLADLEAAAAMRYQALFGTPPAGWSIAADWDARETFLAAALPAPLLATLLEWARAAGCRLVEIVPQLVAALNGWRTLRRPGAWFGVVHGQVLSIAAFEGARLAALRTAVPPPGAGREWLESLVAREALRLGVEAPARLQVCGPAPRSWVSHEEGTKFACTLLEGGTQRAGAVGLACTGRSA